MLISDINEILTGNACTSLCDANSNSTFDAGKAGADSYIDITILCCRLSFYSIFPVFNIIDYILVLFKRKEQFTKTHCISRLSSSSKFLLTKMYIVSYKKL